MKILTTARLCLLAIMMVAQATSMAMAQPGPTKIVLVRHAEFGTTPGGNLGPSLSDAGRQRAMVLAEKMRDEGITLIVTTRFRRTSETASIVADTLGLKPLAVAGDDPDKIVAAQFTAIGGASGGTVLVVGHSNTVPALIAKLGGPRLRAICENAFDRMFVLTGPDAKRELSSLRYGAPSPDPRPNCT